MATCAPAIQTNLLSKSYGTKIAVSNLTLQVEQGEVFGFLGPNGAGKTTSIKMLLGLIRPDSGQGWLLGEPLGKPEVRRRVGFLPEHFRFHDWLTATEFLYLHATLYRMPEKQVRGRVQELLELMGLNAFSKKKLCTFSKGMLQRIGLAQALLNQPELVILDEPTSGLDPVGRRLVRDLIRDLSSRGTTVFLNSHLLSEVEITCDRVAFIKQGKVLSTHSLRTLIENQITLIIRARRLTPETLQGLEQWGQDIRLDGDRLSITLPNESALPEVNRYLVQQGVEVFSFQPQKISLEELFIQVVGMDGGL
jgi:ABC-2 type transport system ATP-binding protein